MRHAQFARNGRSLIDQRLHGALAQHARDRIDLDPFVEHLMPVLQNATAKYSIEGRWLGGLALDFEMVDCELFQAGLYERRLSGHGQLDGTSWHAIVGVALNALGRVQKVDVWEFEMCLSHGCWFLQLVATQVEREAFLEIEDRHFRDLSGLKAGEVAIMLT